MDGPSRWKPLNRPIDVPDEPRQDPRPTGIELLATFPKRHYVAKITRSAWRGEERVTDRIRRENRIENLGGRPFVPSRQQTCVSAFTLFFIRCFALGVRL